METDTQRLRNAEKGKIRAEKAGKCGLTGQLLKCARKQVESR